VPHCEHGLFFGKGAVFEEVFEFGHEFLDVFEIHVDAGETDVGDFVEFLQAMHDHFADFGGGQFPFGGFVDHAFDFVHDGFELGRGNGTLFAGFQQALQNFLALEAFAAAVFLDDHVGNFVDAFVSGEATRAFQAFAAAANGVAGAALAGVNYLVIEMRAERALQLASSPWCVFILRADGPANSSGVQNTHLRRPSTQNQTQEGGVKPPLRILGGLACQFGFDLLVFVFAHALQFA
jgi:hypothetical protein